MQKSQIDSSNRIDISH